MIWVNSEDSRCVKAWESVAGDKKSAKSCVALSPNEDFFIATKVGYIDPRLHPVISPDNYAEQIVQDMIDKGLADYTFSQTASLLEADWAGIPAVTRSYFTAVEVVLIQNKSEGLEEVERHFAAPRLLEPAQ